jgi:hypothetical protein
LVIAIQLQLQFLLGDILGHILDGDAKVRGTNGVSLSFLLFFSLLVLEEEKCNHPDTEHTNANPTLNEVVGLVGLSGVELLGGQGEGDVTLRRCKV